MMCGKLISNFNEAMRETTKSATSCRSWCRVLNMSECKILHARYGNVRLFSNDVLRTYRTQLTIRRCAHIILFVKMS